MKYNTQINEQLPIIYELSKEDNLRFEFNYRFVKTLHAQRTKLKLTQEALSKLSGVNRVTISKLESFQRLASIDIILKLLNALKLDIEFIDKSQE